ncbi:division/cell wall cluster transcriptional repressor MraZ [Leeia sp. TBRC 13508]|uniref:Transcriptional regulator MraZ n=1 Tax=Leeia speluncae TaxID=2884804 RepID=A0ABS8D5K9_9NEIS|nr:division/cell wall cluster transcriptional repressor MraZ [Leeia speluncae]MCB6183488.1 division/cell wall cluster transcriptional repressor MraZ [Leeia speluncae]
MKFRGSATLNLDSKGRLAIPARYRDSLAEVSQGKLVLTADPSKCLLLYPEPEWGPIEERLNQVSSFNPQLRAYQRVVVGYAEDVEMDSAGRILVSPELRAFAGLDKRVVLIGQGKKFELWDELGWQRQCDVALEYSANGLPAELEGFSL